MALQIFRPPGLGGAHAGLELTVEAMQGGIAAPPFNSSESRCSTLWKEKELCYAA